jgi:hypothetical protein
MADSRGSGGSGLFFVVLGALVLGALVILVLPGFLAGPPTPPIPTRAPTASPGATTDPHSVVTPSGVVSIGLEGNDIVIKRTPTGGAPTELGRIPVPGGAPAPSDPFSGSAGFAMVCPAADASLTDGFFFGFVNSAGGIEYSGPSALGQGAPDGLFLFVLSTVGLDPNTPLRAKSSGGELGISINTFGFASSGGQKQASGCFVTG